MCCDLAGLQSEWHKGHRTGDKQVAKGCEWNPPGFLHRQRSQRPSEDSFLLKQTQPDAKESIPHPHHNKTNKTTKTGDSSSRLTKEGKLPKLEIKDERQNEIKCEEEAFEREKDGGAGRSSEA